MLIATYADLAAFYHTHVSALAAERAAILGEGAPAPAALFNVQIEGEQQGQIAKAGDKSDVDDVTYEQADNWFTSYAQAMSAGEVARAALAARHLREVQAAATKAQADNQRTAEAVADKQRNAYRRNDESLLSQLWNWSTNIYDSILDLAPVIADARELEASLLTGARAAAAQVGPNVGRVSASYKLP